MAEMTGKIVQNLPSAQCCQQNRQFGSLYQRDQCAQFKNNFLLFQVRKLTWTGISAMQLHNTSNVSKRVVYCNASPSATVVPSLGKVDFLKLQNGSDIRGVAVDGVAGEPITLTEPVTQAISAAFAAWLLDKKKADSSKRLKISVGHDSRISAQKLQDAASRGIAGADFDVVQYGLASTPAMFNSTLTKNDDILCPVDGAIMITEKPLEGFHIVVDAGNGAGGFFAGNVLEPLGAITSGNKAAMKAITQAVLDNKADLGIIFDTDVDRSAAVDSTGRGKHHRFKRGYKNVIDEAIRLNSVGEESHLAIETSGHGALKENHWLDDGAYLMVDQNHSDLNGGSFREYGEAVLKHLENTSESDPKLQKAPVNYEGVRVSGYGGWFLLRLSLHDPVLPLNIEAPSNEDAVKLGLAVLSAVNEFSALDVSALTKFVQQ
ncbi:hypothetical protein M8C21_022391 [Ambrosia artemisiifolia]|uniref:Alpha-D-phosphohexomutase alpha/beta/alpha domain-containing protein n=1 Tax=Ambrosia artemisiifolia TaxID=4212 RepID=A0AAD5C8D9_AMBAR|nr:hypothetical protein M8C21_022391 [Ambrosia artemisiifolia]